MSKFTHNNKEYNCEFEFTLELISGKWKGVVLWHLQFGTLRYGELKTKLGNITQKMLTQTLRALEKDKLINRKVYTVVPPKVEYSLTPRGEKLIPIFVQLIDWGNEIIVLDNQSCQDNKNNI